MSDAPALVIAAVSALVYGLAYTGVFGHYIVRIHPLEQLTPLVLWSGVWLGVGAILLTSLWSRLEMIRPWALGAWSFLMLTWGTSYFGSWYLGDWDRGVAIAALHMAFPLCMSWAVWRGNRSEIRIREVKV